MTLSDAIKAAIAPYLGKDAKPLTLDELKAAILQAAIANQTNIKTIDLNLVLKQTQVYVSLNIMVDSLQQQIDVLNAQVGTLQSQVLALQGAIDGLTIGSDVQAWDIALQQLSDLALGNNQVLGTNNVGQITQSNRQLRAVGAITLLPYDPLQAGWSASGAVYTDPDGWLWYLPNGAGLSNANVKYLELFTALWGTAAYTIAGGKGANALTDWNAGKTLVIPDMRGRSIASSGTATGGSTSRSIGSTWGAENTSLATANLPSHRHNISIAAFTATGLASNTGTGVGAIAYGSNTITINQVGIAGNRAAVNDGLGAVADTGSGTAFATTDPSKAYLELWWMNTK